MMTAFSIGEPFPLNNRANGTEYCKVVLNETFFDVYYYTLNPNNRDISMWSKGLLEYGVYTSKSIPFFLVCFEREWAFDLSINLNFIESEEVSTIWLNSEDRTVRFYLINARTNILEGLRIIQVNTELADKIRDTCEKQSFEYNTAEEVDRQIVEILKIRTTRDMLSASKLYRSK